MFLLGLFRSLKEPLWFSSFSFSFLATSVYHVYWRHTCSHECCWKSNDSKKAWYSFHYLFFASFDVFIIISYSPPPPSLPPLRIPARICKRKWVNKKIKSHEGSEELKALYCMHILFVIMFVNSLYSVMFLCVHKFESFSTLYWTERRHMSAIVMTRLPFFMYDNFLFSTCCIFKHMK